MDSNFRFPISSAPVFETAVRSPLTLTTRNRVRIHLPPAESQVRTGYPDAAPSRSPTRTGSVQCSEAALILSSPPMPRAFEASSPSERRLTRCAGLIPVASQDLDLHHTVMPEAPRTSTPTEVLAGLVDRVTFHNSEN